MESATVAMLLVVRIRRSLRHFAMALAGKQQPPMMIVHRRQAVARLLAL